MYFNYHLSIRVLIYGMCCFLFACKKPDYLSAKPSSDLIIPQLLKDFQAILDNPVYMNGNGIGVVPALGEASGDDYFVLSDNFAAIPLSGTTYTNIYTWKDNLYSDLSLMPLDWAFAYRTIYYANVVLDGLATLTHTPAQKTDYNNIKGSALFYRAYMLYGLAQVFANHYDVNTAAQTAGLPLKLTGDIGEKLTRASLQQTYDQILGDLTTALSLLPPLPKEKTRPSKAATYAMLARIHLVMGNYDEALNNANAALQLHSSLIDFNSLDPSSYAPIARLNAEVIFHAILVMNNMDIINPFYARVDSVLYDSYNVNDLRKNIFFNDAFTDFQMPGDRGVYFIGTYDGSFSLFAGLATDEVYLIRAECYARKSQIPQAMEDLNTLMRKRWTNTVPYPEITATSSQEALSKILMERRKELLFRGLRWSDLRRLNKEGANITITRSINEQVYTLEPNSKHYTFLIPSDVISFNPGMPQNER